MKESTKQYLNSKYGIESAEIDNFINSQDFLDYINNDTNELYHNYFYNNSKYYSDTTPNKICKIVNPPHYTPQHIRKCNELIDAIGTIAVMILFILILMLAFISLPLS